MNYSLGEINAYLAAIARIEASRAGDVLTLGFAAAQGSGKDVRKLLRELRGG